MYKQTFCVEGTGSFPFDMLRYDCCFPPTLEEAAKLVYSDGRRVVRLCRFVENKKNMPTQGRWQSFGWEVSSIIESQRIPGKITFSKFEIVGKTVLLETLFEQQCWPDDQESSSMICDHSPYDRAPTEEQVFRMRSAKEEK